MTQQRSKLKKLATTLGLIVLAMMTCAQSARAQSTWTPPLGVPAPPFGVNETCGATTITVSNGAPIPNPIPAGAVVQLQGTFSGDRQVRFAGFSDQHACLRGPATITGEWQISGTFGILEKVKFQGKSLVVLSPANGLAVRDTEHTGIAEPRNSGIGITTWNSSTTSNVVVLRANIHDNVPPVAGGDPDNHGVGIGPNRGSGGTVRDIWVLDSTLTYNSGDGVQINGEEEGIAGKLHHIYLGRNKSSRHWQGGFWTKNAWDVVMSENEAFDNVGHGFGYQYDPQRVWIIFNTAYGNAAGVRTGSMNPQPTTPPRRDIYILSNLFYNNKEVGIEVNDNVGGDFLLAHNTVAGSPKGITNGYGPASPVVSSNVVSFGGITFNQGGTPPTLRNNFLGSPPFEAGSYKLAAGSLAIDKGVAEAAYGKFQTLYGRSILVDREGRARPQGSGWDVGAFEFGGTVASPPPPLPSPSTAPSASPSVTPSASPSVHNPSPSPSTAPSALPSASPTPIPPPSPSPCPTCTTILPPSFSFPSCTGGVRTTTELPASVLPDGRMKRTVEVKVTESRCRVEVFSQK